jgi:hypothetical protein
VAEKRGTYRARYEADGIDAEGIERADQRITSREIETRKDETRHDTIEKEVIPLDRCADCSSDHGTTELALVLRFRQYRDATDRRT